MFTQGGAYNRAMKSEKSLALLCPIGGGAVVTNDWSIINYRPIKIVCFYFIEKCLPGPACVTL